MDVPGSSSQTTSNSSPRPSSSTEESLSKCDVTLPVVAGFTAEGTISITTKGRLRTTTNWPTSGHETIKVYLKSYVRENNHCAFIRRDDSLISLRLPASF